jgi:peptidoglycan/xylan/chitin deacetylase (PgdA/CDA1 family)
MKGIVKRVLQWGAAQAAPIIWDLRRTPRLLVLMYHRVLPLDSAERQIEQPGMFVSPSTLDMHLSVLRRYFELVHLNDWLQRVAAGEPTPRHACALTFDDGWRDNYDHAYPILTRHAAPATIFLVSTLIGTNTEFWPNRLARLLSSPDRARALTHELTELLGPALPGNSTHGALSPKDLDLAIRLAKQATETEINRMLDEAQSMSAAAAPKRSVLNEVELRMMGASGLIRYGSHTRTHYRCRETAPMDVLETEIRDSRPEISACVEQAVDLFCYPNGDTTPAAIDLVSRYYEGAVTTQKGWYQSDSNRFLIPRIGVHEDISNRPESFLARISGWL